MFFLSTSQDKEFIKREIQNSVNDGTRNNFIDVDKKIKENILYIGNLDGLYNYPNGMENAVRDIVKIVENTNSSCIHSGRNISLQITKKIALRCIHKIENSEQIQKNIQREKNYRDTILRDVLFNCSIICTYPVNDILSTIKGESNTYSERMAELLDMYDAVIYARKYWKGAAFNLK